VKHWCPAPFLLFLFCFLPLDFVDGASVFQELNKLKEKWVTQLEGVKLYTVRQFRNWAVGKLWSMLRFECVPQSSCVGNLIADAMK
jgi:hypothetical protein